jgi:hypothetical protein
MRLYPNIPHRRFSALVQDVAFLLVLALLAYIGLRVHDTVNKLDVLGKGIHDVGEHVPLVGGDIADAGQRGEDNVHRLANLLGLLTAGIPAVLVCGYYLPPRIAQIRQLTAASHVLEGASQRLVAMRAAFGLPYGQLLRYTRDPLRDLEEERYDALVAAALEDAGLRSS